MFDCLVIGGGVSGLLTALHLQEAHLKVAILERNCIGRESSWAGGGILSPLYPWQFPSCVTALSLWSQARYPEFLQKLHQTTGIDPEYVRNGMLILDTKESENALTWASQNQMNIEKIGKEVLHSHEPELGKYDEALWLADIGQVRNPRLLKSLKGALISKHIPLLEYHSVNSIQFSENRVMGVEIEGHGFVSSKRIVITAGAWSAQLISKFDSQLNIAPVRGQMILFAAQPGLVSRMVLSNGRYIIPRRDGYVLAGSTLEHTGFNKETTLTALQDLKYAAFNLIPRLADYTVERHWAGLRPNSPNGVPYICAYPNIQGLYINSGHFRNGIALGLGSAQLLVDIVLERSPILDPTPYTIDAKR